MDTIIKILQPDQPLLYILIAWTLAWKGITLWHAARNDQKIWYLILLVVNTVGLLEIIYYVFFRKKR